MKAVMTTPVDLGPEQVKSVVGKPDAVTTLPWAEGARRYVRALKGLARRYRAGRDHYMALVTEHEWEWEREDELRDQVEALGIENYTLKQRCKALEAQLEKAVV